MSSPTADTTLQWQSIWDKMWDKTRNQLLISSPRCVRDMNNKYLLSMVVQLSWFRHFLTSGPLPRGTTYIALMWPGAAGTLLILPNIDKRKTGVPPDTPAPMRQGVMASVKATGAEWNTWGGHLGSDPAPPPLDDLGPVGVGVLGRGGGRPD